MDHDVIEYYKSLDREPRTWGGNMEMNREDEIALEESISDWKDKARGVYTYRECPLCALGTKRDGTGRGYEYKCCTNCIILKHTGRPNCINTPYHDKGNPKYYQREIEFLESLRPEKKVEKNVIEVGDEVTIRDYSWSYCLDRGKIIIAHKMNTALYHTVVEIGACLPEGDNHKGKFGNDTIIYDATYGNYIFIREEYLELVKPKHCPECGKAK